MINLSESLSQSLEIKVNTVNKLVMPDVSASRYVDRSLMIAFTYTFIECFTH